MIKENLSNFETYVIAIKRVRNNDGVELPENEQRWEYWDNYLSTANHPFFSTQNCITFSSAKTAENHWKKVCRVRTHNIPSCYDINTLGVFKKTICTTIEEEIKFES